MASLSGPNITTLASSQLGPIIAQPVICYYPISDMFSPTPRYLYYALLALIFVFSRCIWATKVFLGAAGAYAATAAIDIFILISHEAPFPSPQQVTLPFVTNSSGNLPPDALTQTNQVDVQPSSFELDLDVTTAIVVSGLLTGLLLQTWSSAVKSSRIVRYMVLIWNTMLFAASLCAIITWSTTNTSPNQYRFCHANLPDVPSVENDGWDDGTWAGSWNATVRNVFENTGTVWQDLAVNCLYPCFNTSQILRRPDSLRATLFEAGTKFAQLHDPDGWDEDVFSDLIYVFLSVFTAAHILLWLAPLLRLCSPVIPVHEPAKLMRDRKRVLHHFQESWRANVAVCSSCWSLLRVKIGIGKAKPQPAPRRQDIWKPIQLCFDIWVIIVLLASLTLFPFTLIGFIVWIEWYIRKDGAPTETLQQVGQWTVLVSVGLIFMAASMHQFKDRVATTEELRTDIEKAERRLEKLKGYLSEKVR